MTLHVGTSGWAYREWKPDFYPEDLPQKRFLDHYCQILSACEINATFYRLQSENTFTKWRDAAPGGFRYTTKAHRRLTHGKTIDPTEDRSFLDAYVNSVRGLGDKLGAVLFQLPPYRLREHGGLDQLLASLPDDLPIAFEFRHESWDSPEVRSAIADRGGTVCISNTDGSVPKALPEGPLAYVRLRTERYTDEQRAGWASLLQAEAKERPVFAFAKHEGIPAGDPFGGIGLARWLRDEIA